MNPTDDRREAAIKRLKTKQRFHTQLAFFVIVNTMLIVIWAVTGGGHFWPIWSIIGWGIGLTILAYTVYFKHPITEADIQAEIDNQEPGTPPGH
jgi:high-affinity nickel permease